VGELYFIKFVKSYAVNSNRISAYMIRVIPSNIVKVELAKKSNEKKTLLSV
jgi:hypothetical protein